MGRRTAAFPSGSPMANPALRGEVEVVGKQGKRKRRPGRLTVDEIVALLLALALLIWIIHGDGPV